MFLNNLLQFPPGNNGFASYVKRIYPILPDLKIFFKNGSSFISSGTNDLPASLGLRNFFKTIHRYYCLQYFVNIKKELLKNGYSIADIHCVYSPFSEYFFSLKKIPQVITCHDLTPLYYATTNRQKLRYKYLLPLHLKRATKIIAISKFAADQLIEIGIDYRKINIIYNGIKLDNKPILKPKSKNIIVLARHDLNKNIIFALKGYRELLKKSPNWEGKLIIIGKEGKQTKKIKKLIREINSQNIILVKELDNNALSKLIKSSFILISPSFMEGFNYPIIEAMSMGLPTLISNIPVHKELYKESSLLFKLNDEGESLASNILRFYKENYLWSDISKKGYLLAKNFNVKKQQNDILTVLNSI